MPASEKIVSDLFRNHKRELNGFARRRVGQQEAEDVVQDTYLHLLQRGETAALDCPRAYLFRVVSNLATDLMRKTKTRSSYVIEDVELDGLNFGHANPSAAAEGMIEVMQLRTALGAVADRVEIG
jgi:RNA polymerase sigma-70 factor (ECF subfamily)